MSGFFYGFWKSNTDSHYCIGNTYLSFPLTLNILLHEKKITLSEVWFSNKWSVLTYWLRNLNNIGLNLKSDIYLDGLYPLLVVRNLFIISLMASYQHKWIRNLYKCRSFLETITVGYLLFSFGKIQENYHEYTIIQCISLFHFYCLFWLEIKFSLLKYIPKSFHTLPPPLLLAPHHINLFISPFPWKKSKPPRSNNQTLQKRFSKRR